MKKVILSFALALTVATGAFAQKQEGGEKNLELQFAPLGGSPIGMNGIRFRMFNSDGTGAIRIGLGIGGSNETTVSNQQRTVDLPNGKEHIVPELYDQNKSFNFSIRPGYEMHFEGTDRLSPYAGAELIFATGSETLVREFYNGNSSGTENDIEKWSVWEGEVKKGTTTLGLNLVAGVDYYIADNIYLGAELGFGFLNVKQKDKETTVATESYKYSNQEFEGANAQMDGDFSQVYMDGGEVKTSTIIGDGSGKFKNVGWGPNYQATIRLGWLF